MLEIFERDLIAETMRSTIDEVVAEHHSAKTQEHQLTARIGQKLEDRLNSLEILGNRFSVITQDIPDKGRGALESKTGIDLYVGIALSGANGFSKAIFVQAKWANSKDQAGLAEQCEKMLNVSDASYAWIYGPNGVRVYDAAKLIGVPQATLGGRLRGRDINTLMRRVLDCKEGDPKYGIPENAINRRRAVTALMEAINAKVGVDVRIIPQSPE